MKERGTVASACRTPGQRAPSRFDMAATTNGAVTPSAHAGLVQSHSPIDSAGKKRKREDEMSPDQAPVGSAQAQRDILDILRQYVICYPIYGTMLTSAGMTQTLHS